MGAGGGGINAESEDLTAKAIEGEDEGIVDAKRRGKLKVLYLTLPDEFYNRGALR